MLRELVAGRGYCKTTMVGRGGLLRILNRRRLLS